MRWPWGTDADDERTATLVNKGLAALSDPLSLRRFALILGVLNLLIWASVLIVPVDVRSVFERVYELNSKIAMGVLGIVFGLGIWLSYALFRLRLANLEEQELKSGVFATFEFRSHSHERWLVWVASAAGGVMNAIGLVLVNLFLTS